MARRFIDTGFFKDPFVRGLQGSLKGLYVYLFLDCSNGGLWDVELDVARIRCDIPESITDEQIKSTLCDKIFELENGQKWLIKNFVKIQHNGVLKKNNNAHISAINELLKYDLLTENDEGAYVLREGLVSPSGGSQSEPMVKVMVKEEGKGNGKSSGKGKTQNPEKKYQHSDFKKILLELGADKIHLDDWLAVRKKKKAVNSQTALKSFVNECNKNNISIADAVKQCAEKSWSGFKYEWLENDKINNNSANSDYEQRKNLTNAELAKRASESEVGKNFRYS